MHLEVQKCIEYIANYSCYYCRDRKLGSGTIMSRAPLSWENYETNKPFEKRHVKIMRRPESNRL